MIKMLLQIHRVFLVCLHLQLNDNKTKSSQNSSFMMVGKRDNVYALVELAAADQM